jgi:hypothetical protein
VDVSRSQVSETRPGEPEVELDSIARDVGHAQTPFEPARNIEIAILGRHAVEALEAAIGPLKSSA